MSEVKVSVDPEMISIMAEKFKETVANGNNITFKQFVEGFFLPLVKTFGMTKATVQNSLGDKAAIRRDKHGFYQVKYTYVEEQV